MALNSGHSLVEKFFFVRQWARHPLQFGAILPSSSTLCAALAQYVPTDEYVVELGAGTGNLTRALLDQGVPPERLIAVEIDEKCCALLRKKFPHLTVIQGDARHLCSLLPPDIVGHVGTIVSCLPFLNFSPSVRRAIVQACTHVLVSVGQIFLLTYSPISPIPSKAYGFSKKCLKFVFSNVPPASIWRYQLDPS
ncbi:MAG: methyltransferase domain-containing protein [Holosporales bacterium]|jgi:phosphatidylethanolamine/phosphatidyl-N-methylethanolamine N-methyltransferase|nr:methyltransferase domain-containing protein [Holosporales bacterium]